LLKGRLGLESARIPQKDRHGVIWLARGRLTVDSGTLQFVTAGFDENPAGTYSIPFQMLSAIVIQPGVTVSHDVLRLCARHGTGLVAVGTHGVRFYASMPFGPDQSARARRQATLWGDPEKRLYAARRMYAWRLGEVFPDADIEVLRGLEGARAKQAYRRIAEQYGVRWRGRRYDRNAPETGTDIPNQAINHASTAVVSAAMVAVAIAGAIPQLGFIHEDSGYAFVLDVADLYRDEVTLPVAFGAVKERTKRGGELEPLVRKRAGFELRDGKVIPSMIDRIKELFDGDDGSRDAERG